jgi:hypothetical protein
MADDQATLGSFADGDGAADDDGGMSDEASPNRADGSNTDGGSTDGSEADETGTVAPGDGDRVCPWCLAPADRFVETGPTGLACGRCSAALPVGTDWFEARKAVARRPMYETEG